DGEVVEIKEDLKQRSLNVLHYGVKNDGVTDNSESIQRIIDNIDGSETLFFPVGHYLINNPIIIEQAVRILGSFTSGLISGGLSYSTVLRFNMNTDDYRGSTHALRLESRNIHIENITIHNDNEDEKIHQGIGRTGEDFISYCSFKNVRVNKFDYNWNIGSMWGCTFEQCYASYGNVGFRFRGYSTSNVISKCYASNNNYGFFIRNNVYSTFISCASDSNRYGYFIEECRGGIKLIGCGCEMSGITGFHLSNNYGVSLDSIRGWTDGTSGGEFNDRPTLINVTNANRNIELRNIVEDPDTREGVIIDRPYSLRVHPSATCRLDNIKVNYGLDIASNTLFSDSGSLTPNVKVGKYNVILEDGAFLNYRRIDNIVYFNLSFKINDFSSEGELIIEGLPYKANGTLNSNVSNGLNFEISSYLYMYIEHNTDFIILKYPNETNTSIYTINNENIKKGSKISSSGFYFV